MILIIDMHIRDERVLAYLKEHAAKAGGQITITHEAMADHFLCHRNTIMAIIHRLEAAGKITVMRGEKRGGYTYK